MDNKLYPPYIDGTLPAFIKGNTLVVPFQLNRAVSRTDFNCLSLILKTVQTNTVLCDGDPVYASKNIEYDNATGHWKAIFPVGDLVTAGQYYKVQVAFAKGHYDEKLNWIYDTAIGYYSDVGVTKCTTQPNIYIKNLDGNKTSNTHQYEYTGVYSQAADGQDKSEKVYSYRFDLYDEHNVLISTSGEQVHNSSSDTKRFESSDVWLVTKDLKPGYWYTVQYTVTTLNNLVVASPAYKIMQIETVDFDIDAEVSATMIEEDGYVNVCLQPLANAKKVRGSFVLVRGSSEDNYESWQELYRFNLVNQTPDMILWQDFTVRQGVTYKYALQAYNDNGLYSNKLFNKEGPVYADFEDSFLFDGERQLNIRFNPQVSSFKTVLLESKMDTLGGQFPFIFRNGNVKYREFPISGLISMLSDPNEIFMQGIQSVAYTAERSRTAAAGTAYDLDTQLAGDNFRREREFKMAVLEWLNNGEPKLFRSPGEGNYIVRLMNASLSPNATLSRMLHTFSCTAYEIAECTFDNLNKYGFIKAPNANNREMRVNQHALQELFNGVPSPTPGTAYDFPSGAHFLSISNQYTDELVFDFYFLDGSIVNWDVHNVTGHFNIPIDNSPIMKMVFKEGSIDGEAVITYGYYDTNVTNNFSYITNMSVTDKIEQYIGSNLETNLIEGMEDIRLQTGRFYYIKINPRYVIDVFVFDGQYYRDSAKYIPMTTWDTTALYRVKNSNYWLDGSPTKRLAGEPEFTAFVNSNSYSDLNPIDRDGEFRTQGRFEAITNVDDVQTLRIGNGILLDIVYQLKTLEYVVEKTDPEVIRTKALWQYAEDEYKTAAENGATSAALADLKRKVDSAYGTYIFFLEEALKQEQEEALYVI